MDKDMQDFMDRVDAMDRASMIFALSYIIVIATNKFDLPNKLAEEVALRLHMLSILSNERADPSCAH